MKKIILLVVFTFINVNTFAQAQKCIFEPTPEMLNVNNFTNRFHTVQDNGLPMVLNVKFHGVHQASGADIRGINEERFLKIIASLNVKYNSFNIFFKYRGYSFINSIYAETPYNPATTGIGSLKQFLTNISVNAGTYDDNSINIFVVGNNINGDFNGRSFIMVCEGFQEANTNLGFSPFYDFQVAKYMGHTLGLFNVNEYTYDDINNVTNNINPCISSPYIKKPSHSPNSENVTRNVSDSNYNADTKGDMLADTQACFMGYRTSYCNGAGAPLTTFIPHSEILDPSGSMYACTNVESYNYMQPNCSLGIPNSYTAGQKARMREFIISNPAIFNPFLNLLDDGITSDTTVLYQPFAINDNSAGNGGNNSNTFYSKTYTTNTANTGANVWNCGPFVMRFQTGFDCEFYPYNASTITQTPYQHLDYPTTTSISVKIPILSQQIYQNVAPVCFYSFEPFTSGDVKSLSNLGSGVYTQEQLDEIKASDPKLYEELQSGKYHIITKQTDSGFIDQKVFYKN